nr:immunoglobulin light chain junction region [Macaca mulatta]MOX42132.1 immunoglobulin light chain junction region [Macaca mulatta]MOX43569.1 immunoglobulin light chain junction region [Macaca mulatta]MOX44870.1 immunoglobulin light chain junction region [Macaca mulatta]MOX45900.1 immunoglobulin light chain junction region [Macaca mulatta]
DYYCLSGDSSSNHPVF